MAFDWGSAKPGVAWGHSAPRGFTRYAYKVFSCPVDGTYTMYVQVGNTGEVWLNGKSIIQATDWTKVYEVPLKLNKGIYVFGVKVINNGPAVQTPIWFRLLLKDSTGKPVLQADNSWKKSDTPRDWHMFLPASQSTTAMFTKPDTTTSTTAPTTTTTGPSMPTWPGAIPQGTSTVPTQAGIASPMIPTGTTNFLHKYGLPIVLGLGALLVVKLLRD